MRNCENWIKTYLQYTAASEAPTALHFWTAVSTLAGAVRRRVLVNELSFEISPNFYIILVGPAGTVTKSTTIDQGRSLLNEVPDIYFGPDSGTWQGVADCISESTIYIDHGPNKPPTAMSAITMALSELGTFFNPDDSTAISFLTDVWDGKRHIHRHRTRHSGSPEMVNPWVNMIAATTPTWINNNIPVGMVGEGLMSRILFVYADRKRHYVARPSKVVRSKEFYKMRDDLLEDLKHIATLEGEFQYSDAADEWMDNWYLNVLPNRPVHMASDRFSPYFGRKQTHLIKLAMIMSIAIRDDLTFTVDDFTTALWYLEEAERNMLTVFEHMGIVDEAKHVANVTQFVRVYKEIGYSELWNCCRNTMTEADFQHALKQAIDGKLLKVVGVRPDFKIVPVAPSH